MIHGFVKVAAATPAIEVADPSKNFAAIEACIQRAAHDGVELLVLPELCVSGYTCGDLFGQDVLLGGCTDALLRIAKCTEKYAMLVFVGVPVRAGNALYNCAAALCGGKILAFLPKQNLPNYAEFYEKRNFSAYDGENRTVLFGGEAVPFGNKFIFCSKDDPAFSVGAEICEDLWVPVPPSVQACAAGANIIVNLSASDETAGKAEYRRVLVRSQSAKCVCGYVYADAGEGESTTDVVFSGHDLVYEYGERLAESLPFAGGYALSEIDVHRIAFERRRLGMPVSENGFEKISFSACGGSTELVRRFERFPFVPQGEALRPRAEEILQIQAKGLEKRLKHTNAKAAVLGISGGLDSALALLVTVRAFDALGRSRNEIVGVTMPCFGTTDKTRGNSLRLMRALGISNRVVPIADTVRSHFGDIGHDETVRNAAYENAQARVRTLVLMDLANDLGGLVVGTGDLSELALGWATYNGDHMSMYGVNCSVPKTLVKFLVRCEAERLGGEAGAVLSDILSTEISPELLPPEEGKIAQKTEELVGPYELHDFFLYHVIRRGCSPAKVFYLAKAAFGDAYESAVIKKWLLNFYRRFFSQQFKRSCSPDGVKVGSVALSPRGDWRMPSDASAALWLHEAENL